jgi:hypothetical protein
LLQQLTFSHDYHGAEQFLYFDVCFAAYVLVVSTSIVIEELLCPI